MATIPTEGLQNYLLGAPYAPSSRSHSAASSTVSKDENACGTQFGIFRDFLHRYPHFIALSFQFYCRRR